MFSGRRSQLSIIIPRSLLHTTTGSDSDTPEVHTDYNFTPEHSPLKDISLVSASSAKKSLSFSDHDSVVRIIYTNDKLLNVCESGGGVL